MRWRVACRRRASLQGKKCCIGSGSVARCRALKAVPCCAPHTKERVDRWMEKPTVLATRSEHTEREGRRRVASASPTPRSGLWDPCETPGSNPTTGTSAPTVSTARCWSRSCEDWINDPHVLVLTPTGPNIPGGLFNASNVREGWSQPTRPASTHFQPLRSEAATWNGLSQRVAMKAMRQAKSKCGTGLSSRSNTA